MVGDNVRIIEGYLYDNGRIMVGDNGRILVGYNGRIMVG